MWSVRQSVAVKAVEIAQVTERGPSVHDEGQIGPSILLKRESSSWNDVIALFT